MRTGSTGLRSAAVLAALFASLVSASGASGQQFVPTPVIHGEAREGKTLVATSDPVLPLGTTYTWQRCVAEPCPGTWQDIPGASGSSNRYTLVAADVGAFIRVIATQTPFGSRASAKVGPVAPATDPPPPEPPITQHPEQGLPDPVVHQTANLLPIDGTGTIFVLEPGDTEFRPVFDPEQVSLESIVDTRLGHVDVVTALNEEGDLQVAEFWAGRFELTQTPGDRPLTEFELVSAPDALPGLDRSHDRPGVAERRRGAGRLWGRGRCRCRTTGRHSSGTVRGTWWLTIDRRNGTATKVKRGKVSVRDFGRRKTVKVRGGETYLARARR